MSEAKRDLFMEWFQRFGTTLRDDEYEGIIEALVEHDRQVAERAWDLGQAKGLAEAHDLSRNVQRPRLNPYRAAKGAS